MTPSKLMRPSAWSMMSTKDNISLLPLAGSVPVDQKYLKLMSART
jgi:hypothetical protein